MSFKPLAILLLACLRLSAAPPPHPDSERTRGTPQGKVTRHEFRSNVFKGTVRQYYVYVPAQYQPNADAALMVFQDGHAYVDVNGSFRATIVMDNLIHRKEMPVTIGVFVNPGVFADSLDEKQDWNHPKGSRSNRSVEYDTLSDAYVRMLDEELLPEVSKSYRISQTPSKRAICGSSSGGICAFTAAWQRPESFGKVVSHIGSFTNIRGGDAYPGIIRKTPKKPIRVLLQDGSGDLDNEHGNWWLGNLQMEAALKFKNYDYKTVWGEGGHDGKHAGAVFPDTLRWIWRP